MPVSGVSVRPCWALAVTSTHTWNSDAYALHHVRAYVHTYTHAHTFSNTCTRTHTHTHGLLDISCPCIQVLRKSCGIPPCLHATWPPCRAPLLRIFAALRCHSLSPAAHLFVCFCTKHTSQEDEHYKCAHICTHTCTHTHTPHLAMVRPQGVAPPPLPSPPAPPPPPLPPPPPSTGTRVSSRAKRPPPARDGFVYMDKAVNVLSPPHPPPPSTDQASSCRTKRQKAAGGSVQRLQQAAAHSGSKRHRTAGCDSCAELSPGTQAFAVTAAPSQATQAPYHGVPQITVPTSSTFPLSLPTILGPNTTDRASPPPPPPPPPPPTAQHPTATPPTTTSLIPHHHHNLAPPPPPLPSSAPSHTAPTTAVLAPSGHHTQPPPSHCIAAPPHAAITLFSPKSPSRTPVPAPGPNHTPRHTLPPPSAPTQSHTHDPFPPPSSHPYLSQDPQKLPHPHFHAVQATPAHPYSTQATPATLARPHST